MEPGWIGGKVKYNICTSEWIACYCEISSKLQCPNCNNMTNFQHIQFSNDN